MNRLIAASSSTNLVLLALVFWTPGRHCAADEAHELHLALHAKSLESLESNDRENVENTADLLRSILTANPHEFVTRYLSEQRWLELNLGSDGTFGAQSLEFGGCMNVITGEAEGNWAVELDQIQFFSVDDDGDLAGFFSSGRIRPDDHALILQGGETLVVDDAWQHSP